MRSRYFFAAAVLLPFVTMPSVAFADQTGNWQRAARLAEQTVPNAYAYYPIWDRLCTYQGGPKSNTWACRWSAD